MNHDDIESASLFLDKLTKEKIIEQLEGDPSPKGSCEFMTDVIYAVVAVGNRIQAPGITLALGRYHAGTWSAETAAADMFAIIEQSCKKYPTQHQC